MIPAGEFWQIAAVLTALLGIFLSVIWGVISWLVDRLTKALISQINNLIKQIDDLKVSIDADSKRVQDFERSLLELRAELPRDYVRREDHIRYAAVIEAKQDAGAAKVEALTMSVNRLLMRMEKDEHRG